MNTSFDFQIDQQPENGYNMHAMQFNSSYSPKLFMPNQNSPIPFLFKQSPFQNNANKSNSSYNMIQQHHNYFHSAKLGQIGGCGSNFSQYVKEQKQTREQNGYFDSNSKNISQFNSYQGGEEIKPFSENNNAYMAQHLPQFFKSDSSNEINEKHTRGGYILNQSYLPPNNFVPHSQIEDNKNGIQNKDSNNLKIKRSRGRPKKIKQNILIQHDTTHQSINNNNNNSTNDNNQTEEKQCSDEGQKECQKDSEINPKNGPKSEEKDPSNDKNDSQMIQESKTQYNRYQILTRKANKENKQKYTDLSSEEESEEDISNISEKKPVKKNKISKRKEEQLTQNTFFNNHARQPNSSFTYYKQSSAQSSSKHHKIKPDILETITQLGSPGSVQQIKQKWAGISRSNSDLQTSNNPMNESKNKMRVLNQKQQQEEEEPKQNNMHCHTKSNKNFVDSVSTPTFPTVCSPHFNNLQKIISKDRQQEIHSSQKSSREEKPKNLENQALTNSKQQQQQQQKQQQNSNNNSLSKFQNSSPPPYQGNIKLSNKNNNSNKQKQDEDNYENSIEIESEQKDHSLMNQSTTLQSKILESSLKDLHKKQLKRTKSSLQLNHSNHKNLPFQNMRNSAFQKSSIQNKSRRIKKQNQPRYNPFNCQNDVFNRAQQQKQQQNYNFMNNFNIPQFFQQQSQMQNIQIFYQQFNSLSEKQCEAIFPKLISHLESLRIMNLQQASKIHIFSQQLLFEYHERKKYNQYLKQKKQQNKAQNNSQNNRSQSSNNMNKHNNSNNISNKNIKSLYSNSQNKQNAILPPSFNSRRK